MILLLRDINDDFQLISRITTLNLGYKSEIKRAKQQKKREKN